MIAKRAFPARSQLAALNPDPSVKVAWKQLAAAAGVDDWALARAVAGELGLEVADDLSAPDTFATQLIPEKLASEHLVLPLRVQDGRLVVAAACPFEGGGMQRIKFVADRNLRVLVAPPDELMNAIGVAYSLVAEKQGKGMGTLRWTPEGSPVAGIAQEESAIVQLSRSLLLEAIERRASDLHLQPFAGGGVVRARIDGLLQRLMFVPGPVLEAVVRYFKAQGGMDPTNQRVAQDGRLSLILGSRDYDLRLSVLPASRGERLVIRFLDQNRVYRLGGMGFSVAGLQAIRGLAANTAGVVLLTGPTGSGKTSTLYSMLAEINRVGVSIITVEDPVEYRLPGISQVEVNRKAGLTFASALRSILRQDPDVVLVGEIRDGETAEIAMQAALTGHLVLSTLHTNDALGAFPRLLDLGVQPSILADAVLGVVAQRLLRRLCAKCRAPVAEPLLPDEAFFREATGELPSYRAAGCAACGGTGYHGRFPVTEIVEMTPELAQQVARGHSDLAQMRSATAGPLASMAVTAAHRIISGDTTVGEATRVIGRRFWTDVAASFGRAVPSGAFVAVSQQESSSTGLSVLLFETDARQREAIAAALQGMRVRVHATGETEMVRGILEKNDDLAMLILDLEAGGGRDNVELLQRLRIAAAWARLPRLILVPAEDRRLHELLEEHGVSDYLVKPATPETVVARARAVLAR